MLCLTTCSLTRWSPTSTPWQQVTWQMVWGVRFKHSLSWRRTLHLCWNACKLINSSANNPKSHPPSGELQAKFPSWMIKPHAFDKLVKRHLFTTAGWHRRQSWLSWMWREQAVPQASWSMSVRPTLLFQPTRQPGAVPCLCGNSKGAGVQGKHRHSGPASS